MAAREVMSSARLEAFSDGVLAIIITIMVLDLRAPVSPEPAALKALWPIFLCYSLSFFIIAVYWLNHHRLFHFVKVVSTGVLWANLFFLFCLSLIPFFTHYMSGAGGNARLMPHSVELYAAWMLVCVVAGSILRVVALRDAPDDPHARWLLSRAVRRNVFAIGCYAIAVPLAFLAVWPALALISATAGAYVLPDFGSRRKERR